MFFLSTCSWRGFWGLPCTLQLFTITSVEPRNGRLLALHTLDGDERDQQQKRCCLLRYRINYSFKKIYDAIPWCQFNLSDSMDRRGWCLAPVQTCFIYIYSFYFCFSGESCLPFGNLIYISRPNARFCKKNYSPVIYNLERLSTRNTPLSLIFRGKGLLLSLP